MQNKIAIACITMGIEPTVENPVAYPVEDPGLDALQTRSEIRLLTDF
jgi:hypothetical protein